MNLVVVVVVVFVVDCILLQFHHQNVGHGRPQGMLWEWWVLVGVVRCRVVGYGNGVESGMRVDRERQSG